MSALELKVPPVVVGLIVAAAMWAAARLAPSLALPLPFAVRVAVASVLVAAGVGLIGAGAKLFLRAKTTIDPTKPAEASSLVVTGIYRFTRNPMYAGGLLALLGWGVYLSNALALALSAVLVLYINRFQIVPEERTLSGIFGAEYDAYKARVRRWL